MPGDDEPFDDADLEHAEPVESDGVAFDTEADVACPYCGEIVTLALDPGGGRSQVYVEDCQVCCSPWRVHVEYDDEGAAEVWAEALQ